MSDIKFDNLDNEIKQKAKSREMYKIIYTTEDGNDVEYEVVATFKSKKNKKIYYIMTDNTRSKKNELNITPFYINYDEKSDVYVADNEMFYPVVDDNELQMVLDVFDNIKNNL